MIFSKENSYRYPSCVWDILDISGNEKLVLIILCCFLYREDDIESYSATYEDIAGYAGLCVSSANKHLWGLKAKGYISISREIGKVKNTYRVTDKFVKLTEYTI